MRVVCCSSGCCGIKHIRDFHRLPSKEGGHWCTKGHSEDTSTTEPDAYSDFLDVPTMTCTEEEYFRLLVSLTKEKRPSGMITVNLATEDEDEDERYASPFVDAWRPIFLDEGFREVKFTNSNTGNIIHHFTLIYGD